MPNILTCKWRTANTTIYAIVHAEPSVDDIFLGMMEDVTLASHIVEMHNAQIDN